ncbi:transposase, partial [Streptomyces sp. NPDC048527]|uniref:transposase n=1 Tax=Streptomyces sp. NPDC048527 TaxID=3365568 RepID=UPI003715E468
APDRRQEQRDPRLRPLLGRLDPHGCAITADAMRTRTDHAEQVAARGAHYILIVKGNQKNLRGQMRRLPWREIPLQHHAIESGHGRREIRRLKVCTVHPGLLLPQALQAISIKRRRTSRTTGKSTITTVYAITGVAPVQATRPSSSAGPGRSRPCIA